VFWLVVPALLGLMLRKRQQPICCVAGGICMHFVRMFVVGPRRS
jgi:hypothetical protein